MPSRTRSRRRRPTLTWLSSTVAPGRTIAESDAHLLLAPPQRLSVPRWGLPSLACGVREAETDDDAEGRGRGTMTGETGTVPVTVCNANRLTGTMRGQS